MLKSLETKDLKKYSELKLDNLRQINFALGNNNIWWTTILEAVSLGN